MKSIRADFEKMKASYPLHSSFIHFGRAIYGRKYTPEIIRRCSIRLIEKEDYTKSARNQLSVHFDKLTNMAEETDFWPKIRLGGVKKIPTKDSIKIG
ncbi:MAG: hypothetical protein WCO30_02415 [bacterium]